MINKPGIRSKILGELVKLSNNLGRIDYHLAIIGEGNTSAKVETKDVAGSFFIKASGTHLATVTENDFIQVYFEPIMELIGMENPTSEEINNIFEKAKELGFRDALNTGKVDLRKWIDENTGRNNLDIIFDCVGTEQSINIAINNAREGSQIIDIGVYHH